MPVSKKEFKKGKEVTKEADEAEVRSLYPSLLKKEKK